MKFVLGGTRGLSHVVLDYYLISTSQRENAYITQVQTSQMSMLHIYRPRRHDARVLTKPQYALKRIYSYLDILATQSNLGFYFPVTKQNRPAILGGFKFLFTVALFILQSRSARTVVISAYFFSMKFISIANRDRVNTTLNILHYFRF